jgi:phenylacetate-CoA ligase
MKEKFVWNEKMELMPDDKMRDIQWQKLKTTLDFVYEKSPFYKRKFDEAGVRPSDIRSFDDFSSKVPVTSKDDLRNMQKEGYPLGSNMTVSLEDIVWITASTGTTGKPTYTCCTQKDWQMWMECIKRMFWLGGIRPGDVHFHALGLSNWISGISFTQAARELGATVVSVGVPTPAERMVMLIQDVGATSMVSTPSYAEHFAERVEAMGIKPSELGIRKFVCGGEPGAGIPVVKEKIEKLWGCDLRDLWGSPEMIAGDKMECHYKNGMHIVNREYCYNEVCDPDTKLPLDLKDGTEGAFIYTSLDKEAGPLIRFDVRDQVKVWTTPCECGYPGIRVTVTGRYDDMMKIKGVKVWPSTIKDIVASFAPRLTSQFKIILSQKPLQFRVEGPTKLRVEYGVGVKPEELEGLKREIGDKVRTVTLWAPETIELVPPGSIPPPEFKAKYVEVEERH